MVVSDVCDFGRNNGNSEWGQKADHRREGSEVQMAFSRYFTKKKKERGSMIDRGRCRTKV